MQEEQQRLTAYEESLSDQELQDLIARTGELLQLQHTPNDEQTLALLPRLSREDLDRTPKYHRVRVDKSDAATFMVNELDTNSIMYMDFGLDCSAIGTDLLPWMDLFATIATEIGTTKRDYIRFAKDINIYTGGFSHSFSTHVNIKDNSQLLPVLWFQIKALSGYLPQAVEIIREVFGELDLKNRQRIKEIVQREFAWSEHSVQSEGYSIASTRVFAQLSRAGMINEYVSGATAYLALKNLASNYDTLENEFIEKLTALRDLVFQAKGLMISVTGAGPDIEQFKSLAQNVGNSLHNSSNQDNATNFSELSRNQAFCTSAEVVYNVQGCNLFSGQNNYSGHFEVLKTWLSRDYLWNTVRQVGGAYGCFVQFNPITGNFGLVSYRDPQITKTYEAYDAVAVSVQDLELSRPALDQLIIGTYGSLNPLQGPASRGLTARNEYLSGITPEYKQQRIGEVVDTTVDTMRGFSPLFQNLQENSFRATIGNCDKIRKHADQFDDIVEL